LWILWCACLLLVALTFWIPLQCFAIVAKIVARSFMRVFRGYWYLALLVAIPVVYLNVPGLREWEKNINPTEPVKIKRPVKFADVSPYGYVGTGLKLLCNTYHTIEFWNESDGMHRHWFFYADPQIKLSEERKKVNEGYKVIWKHREHDFYKALLCAR